MDNNFDVIVVGAGHAGIEAAFASSRLGLKTALFTIYLDKIALMSCNPSIGGPGKSNLVTEIGVLGAQMSKTIDENNLQLKNLNHTKGLAARITRAQADKEKYRLSMREKLEMQENLSVIQGTITDLLIENKKVYGIKDELGMTYYAKAVILCTGTFLDAYYIIGDVKYKSGRAGEKSSVDLPKSLKENGIEFDRYQTATPPRIDKKSIDFSNLQKLESDTDPRFFSYETVNNNYKGRPTYLTYTTKKTIEVAKELLKYSPIVTGIVGTKGPRHCPSLDRKVLNFPDKYDHQIFLEEESEYNDEIYVNGFTTAMPAFAQEKMLHTIKGLENAKILRYGYAIEYDYIPSYQLKHTMESKVIEGLYTAGTINGTSGYEEAATQGFIAGVNAARKIQGKKEIVIDRSEAYIGVLIDDIINKSTPEPYRVLPSRAEYRLSLRQDNTFLRLLEISDEIGIMPKEVISYFRKVKLEIDEEIKRLKSIKIYPTNETNEKLSKIKENAAMTSPNTAYEFLARQEINYDNLHEFIEVKELDKLTKEQVEINAKYDAFIKREEKQIENYKKLENMLIPDNFDYSSVTGLSNIAKSGLSYVKPQNIGQASRISGVTYNDIALLIAILNK
ncbi:tRNA uridine-5-carboxymethylaminomethyl(34) synthesis enzyme MnmG [Oceanivirga miroungae]|uniref:tRNA uridine 5-carboxymethylaminomethyl modification enzyme MnmG n=1 Tax=Oceanivirga miroungae TaxID=1130046 RepID=A0A6I8MC69_9FUSO|nr:tRNA uridine-5-carboxymethylaminomethyl(34) synthesis enzyme MnmG [Oceanivirga miroungae]VWL85815.1 tRNA uridine 5-carboxymethylaminomethyl modification protein GidA [Oceanivirga miroungae]